MIRFDYVKDHPVFRHGSKLTGLSQYDDWWMDSSVLNSRWLEYGENVLCAVRGTSDTYKGITILRAGSTSDLGDPASWTILHKDAPCFQATDMPAPYGNYQAPLTGLDFFVDPTVTTNGYDRLWVSFKSKETNLSRGDYPNWDQTFTGGAVSATQDLGFSIAWAENVKITITSGGAELVQDTDYSIQNLGTGSNCQITYLTNQAGTGLTFDYVQKAFRYSAYSDDGGQTWTYYGPMVGHDGSPQLFGQPSAFYYDDGTHDWHMMTTDTTDAPGSAFNYVRSTGPSGGQWVWEDDTAIADLGGNGFWNDTCAIGTGDYTDGTYVYLLGTAGYGADTAWNYDPETLEDLTVDIDDHSDYPTAIGLWRCPLNDMTTAESWEAYPLNPIMLRHSIGKSASGGIWNPSVIGEGTNLRITHEAVGVTFPPVNGQQAMHLKDSQYGKFYSSLTADNNAAYNVPDITIYMKIVLKDLGAPLFKRGPLPFDAREPNYEAGDYFCHVTDEGAVELVHWYSNGTGTVRRSIKTDDYVISVGTEHEIVVGLGQNGTRIYVDANIAEVTGEPASPDLTTKNLIFGSSGMIPKEFYGYVEQIRIMDSYETFNNIIAASIASTVGYWNFGNTWVAGSSSTDATAGDGSPTGNDLRCGESVKRGSIITETEVTVPGKFNSAYLPGVGIGYTRGTGGSQQHQAYYVGGEFADVWDVDAIPEGSEVYIQNAKTGRFLGEDGISSEPVLFVTDRIKGFTRFARGVEYLETSDRYKEDTSVSMQAEKSDYSSPYNRYDMQHWHLIAKDDGTYLIQNRACSRVLRDDGVALRVSPWSGDFSNRWHITIK